MEDERRKFLQGLLALGGGAAILPELVEAAQQTLKVEQPFYSTEVNRQTETRIDERTVDRQSQIVIIGDFDEFRAFDGPYRRRTSGDVGV